MLQDKSGSLDGFKAVQYMKEHIYDVPSEMSEYVAKAWLQRGVCEIYNPTIEKIETKTVKKTTTKRKR